LGDADDVRSRLQAKGLVHPVHERAGFDESLDAGSLVSGELHGPNPAEHNHQTVTNEKLAQFSNRCRLICSDCKCHLVVPRDSLAESITALCPAHVSTSCSKSSNLCSGGVRTKLSNAASACVPQDPPRCACHRTPIHGRTPPMFSRIRYRP